MQQPLPAKPETVADSTPDVREVAPGVWKITMPIPFPLRTVNVYVLAGREGWVIVDTGIGTPDARAAFYAGLQQLGTRPDKLQAIVLTHHHPDHIGLSGELYEQSGAQVYMHPLDVAAVNRNWAGSLPERFKRVSQFFAQHGLPHTELWYTKADQKTMRSLIRVPPLEAFSPVEDGDYLELAGERYKIIWVPGHADGQICLLRERDGVFLSADHVLPRITPNVGLYSQFDRPNPLGDYLASLAKVARLPATLVLPGHGEPFNGLAGRTAEIVAHHEERLAHILALLTERPQHANQLTEQLFSHRFLNDEARRMAVAEVLSHCEYLRYGGKVEQRPVADGLILYAAV